MTDNLKVFNVVDPITDRVVSKVAQSYQRVATRHPYSKWLVLNMNALNKMVTCKRLDDLRVWLELSRRQERENVVRFTNREVAISLGMTDAQVSNAINRLRGNGILSTTVSAAGKSHKLAPGLQWMGDTKKFPRSSTPIGKDEVYNPDVKWGKRAQSESVSA